MFYEHKFYCDVKINFPRMCNDLPKGQTKSKCSYEIIVSPKIATKKFLDFCPEIFCSFLGASKKLWGLSVGFLTSNITYFNKPGASWRLKSV